ncbi:DUF5076 domain-containing protein [Microbulbifer sp. SSSA008]|uniref:DUF5076 domain-containing protein n=1 Tax=Microbulbifer sp. SSSA008 TaxID=3243380 RepID=UPI00403A7213
MTKELIAPPSASEAENATEILRSWIIDGKLHCSLLPTIWEDSPETWGILLADVAGHVSNALSETTGKEKEEILQQIKELFVAELSSPTDEPDGEFRD